MDLAVHAGRAQRRDPRDDRRQQAGRLLHPARRLPRLRAARRQPAHRARSTCAVMVWDWGKYLGHDALEKGVDVCVSSWTRIAPNTLPAMAKAAANYMNSQLIKMEAIKERLRRGHRPRRRRLRLRGQRREHLPGQERRARHAAARRRRSCRASRATRVITLARRLGHRGRGAGAPARDALPRRRAVLHRHRRRDHADPLGRPDRTVGNGTRGPVTAALQKAFFDVIECRVPDEHGWLTFVTQRPWSGAAAPVGDAVGRRRSGGERCTSTIC